MILQLGSIFAGIGNFLKTGLEAALPSLRPLAGQVLGGFADVGRQLLQRELVRPLQRKQKAVIRGQLREQSNLAGQTPAIPSTTAVATGGRVFRPPLLVTNVIPPGPAPPVIRPVGLRAGPADRIAARVLKGISRGGVLRGAAMRAAGPAGLALTAITTSRRRSAMQATFPRGVDPMFVGPRQAGANGGAFRFPRRLGAGGNGMATGNGFEAQLPGLAGNGQRVWERTPDGCNVQHYVCDTDTGTIAPIQDVANPKGRERFRLDLATSKFIKLNPRRMNPLNFRAASRARSRTASLLRIVKTMFTEHRREKTGAVRPRKRRKKK